MLAIAKSMAAPTGPGSLFRPTPGGGKRPSEIPLVSGCSLCLEPAIDRARMLSRHFPLAWACSGGDRRRCCSQTAHTRPGGVCHGPCSWAGYSPPSYTRRRTSWAGLSGAACSVSDTRSKPALLHGLGRGWNSPFPQAVAQAMRSNTGRPGAVIVFRTFWPTWISVIYLEKLRDWSLGLVTLFQRPICGASIRLRWLYPVAACQAMRPLRLIWAI